MLPFPCLFPVSNRMAWPSLACERRHWRYQPVILPATGCCALYYAAFERGLESATPGAASVAFEIDRKTCLKRRKQP